MRVTFGAATAEHLLLIAVPSGGTKLVSRGQGGAAVSKSDIEIAREAKLRPIEAVAESLGVPGEALHRYGHHIAKVQLDFVETLKDRPDGRLDTSFGRLREPIVTTPTGRSSQSHEANTCTQA
jgi:hypothetical protein